MNTTNPVILITGASSGIGRAAAELFSARGARLILAARREDRLRDLARSLTERGGDALAVRADVTLPDDAERMVTAALERFGRIDVLINNTGILRMASWADMSVEEMRQIFETNFWGVVHATRAALPHLRRQGSGHVVNVGSGVSRRGLPFMAAYSASKFALAGWTESLRLEEASHGVTFTTVYPGGVDTEMPHSVDEGRLPAGYVRHEGARISAERAARALVKAVEKRPLEVYVPGWVRPTAWLATVWPSATDWILKKHYGDALWK
jgi:NAD(P)-dependent dehydrogenase (short-subunit alcohol dehydrogenase family)